MQPTSTGWFVVRRSEHFVRWCAWREWLATRCRCAFCPDALTTALEWPPETMEEVRSVVAKLNEARTAANADGKLKGSLRPLLPDELAPWDRWGISRVLDMERRHREDKHWNPSLTGHDVEEKQIPLSRVLAVISDTYRRYDYDPRKKPGRPERGGYEARPMPSLKAWHTDEEMARLRMEALRKREGDDEAERHT